MAKAQQATFKKKATSKLEREERVIDYFLSKWNVLHNSEYRIESRPDRITKNSHQGQRNIDAIAIDVNRRKKLAIEHTRLATFCEQIKGDADFQRCYRVLEAFLQEHEDFSGTACFWRDNPHTRNHEQICKELMQNIIEMHRQGIDYKQFLVGSKKVYELNELSAARTKRNEMNGVDVSINTNGNRGIGRYKPSELIQGQGLKCTISKALSSKMKPLSRYAPEEYVRILLLDSDDFILASLSDIAQTFREVFSAGDYGYCIDQVVLMQQLNGHVSNIKFLNQQEITSHRISRESLDWEKTTH